MNSDSFAFRLASVMDERGITQERLAAELGVTQAAVSRWMAGTMPRRRTATALIKVLGVSGQWLMTGEGIRIGKSEHLAGLDKMPGPARARALLLARHELKEKFPERLRWLRKQLGLSLDEFARKIGFTRSYISRLENASRCNPSAKLLAQIMSVFLVNSGWLVASMGEPFLKPAAQPDTARVELLKGLNQKASEKQLQPTLESIITVGSMDEAQILRWAMAIRETNDPGIGQAFKQKVIRVLGQFLTKRLSQSAFHNPLKLAGKGKSGTP